MQKSINTWLLAMRAETLVASISPMIIGTILASKISSINYYFLVITFLYGLLLHIGTNLSNDYYDYLKGADNENRIAPFSTIQKKLTSLNEIKLAFSIAFLAAFILGLILIARGGTIAAILFALPIIFGYHYTAGQKPLGYLGLGEILVLIFFGPYACLGTYYLQTLSLSYIPILVGLAPGFLSMAILVVNNLRDIDVDRPADKLTLAVRFGIKFAKIEYVFCIILAFLVPFFYFMLLKKPLMLSSSIFIFFTPFKLLFNFKDPKILNLGLQKTVLLLIIFTVIFCSCLIFC